MAESLGQRPSALWGIRPPDGWVAYQVDAAVSLLGRWVDGRLAQTDERGRPVHTLAALLAGRAASEGEAAGGRRQAAPRPEGTRPRRYRSFLKGD